MSLVEWVAPLAAFMVCWLTLAWLLRRGKSLPMDHPNHRSLHETPTPRIGGLGIMAGVAAACMWLADAPMLPAMLAALALAALSLLDDVRGLPVVLRFLAHFVAALACLLELGLSGWALVGTTIIVVAPALATLCAAIAAAALAFLCFNFPPARLFMGDTGSIPLGFLAATLGIAGIWHNTWPWLFPLLVFSPFIIDASVTLVRRALSGEKVWRAHRSHYYQRAVLLGATHRQLAVAAYLLMLMATALAFALRALPQHVEWLLILSAAMYSLVFLAIDRRWHQVRNEH